MGGIHKFIYISILSFLLFGVGSLASPATEAKDIALTYYDDGLDCPGNCDEHVVFDPWHNGTVNAFSPPMINRQDAANHKCKKNGSCIICFSEKDNSCLETTYRGSGPPNGRFDVTPLFLAKHCANEGSPDQVKSLCSALKKNARKLKNKTNCFKVPTSAKCVAVLEAAVASYNADKPEYDRCVTLGVPSYNSTEPDRMKHRSTKAGCGYSQNIRERNSACDVNSNDLKCKTWQRLLPGACRAGTFVGKWGTDCCSGVELTDASYGGNECKNFYR